MKIVKSFLTAKVISDISELDIGEVAIFKDKLCFRKFDGDVSKINCFDESKQEFIVTIYGVRVSFVNNSDKIERVLIERHISLDGSINDDEKIGSSSGLSFRAENHVFYNGLFDDLEPFKSMEKVYTQIQEYGSPYSDDLYIGEFVKLPIFFKNKEKTKTIDGVQFDYYLISPICFDDFYPVESHKKDSKYVDCIFLESDWRQNEYKRCVYPANYEPEGIVDGISSVIFNNKLIDDVIFYCYLYYIYFIKTANFKPFSDINPQKKSIFINGARGFASFDNYDSSMLTYLYNMSGGNSSDLSDVLTQDEISKYPWYLILNNGTSDNTFFENIFFEDCVYNINGYTEFESGIGYKHPVSLVAHPRFFPQKSRGCVFFLVSELMELQFLDTGEDQFRAYKEIKSSDADTYIIKLIPFFYNKTDVYQSNFVREDAVIENNTYTDSGNFCIDNLRNILPVFFNAYIPFEKNNTEYFDENLRKDIVENYNVLIRTGNSTGLLPNMNYEKAMCVCSSTEIDIPYCNKNHVCYKNINSFYNRGVIDNSVFVSFLNFFVCVSRGNVAGNDNIVVKSNATKLGKIRINNSITDSCLCYFYRGAYLDGNTINFDWCSMTIQPLSQPYEDYDYDNSTNLGNSFYVSRIFYYPYK